MISLTLMKPEALASMAQGVRSAIHGITRCSVDICLQIEIKQQVYLLDRELSARLHYH